MPGTYDLQGKFIADTYTHLMQKPDINKEEYYNGNGDQIIVINRDAIGTIKMFYPANGVLANYFDTSTGLPQNSTTYPDAAVWQGWALCDGQGGRPDLRGRFIVGHTYTIPGDTSTNSQKNKPEFNYVGKQGAGTFDSTYDPITGSASADNILRRVNIPPHRHGYTFFTQEYEGQLNWETYHATLLGSGMTPTLGNDDGTSNTRLEDGNDSVNRRYYTNTGDGTTNLGDQGEVGDPTDNNNPKAFYPAYVALVYVMRVS
jgi:hypothetical protein